MTTSRIHIRSPKMFPFYRHFLLIVSITTLIDANETDRKALLLDPKNVERLREMFARSHELALAGLYEFGPLNPLKHKSKELATVSDGNLIQKSSIINEAPGVGDDIASVIDNKLKQTVTNGSLKVNEETRDQDKKNLHHDVHAKSDARQSSLFSSFRPSFPTLGSTNPLMGSFLRPPSLPTLPTMATFPTPYQPPPRQPKTSVIGNSGGPMALTNDNVVVVNVLSGF